MENVGRRRTKRIRNIIREEQNAIYIIQNKNDKTCLCKYHHFPSFTIFHLSPFSLFSTVSFRDCHFVRQINFELYHHFPSFTIFPLSPFSLFHHFLIFIIFSFLHLNKRCFKSSHCIGHFGKGTKQIPFVFTSDIHTRTLIIIK